MSKIHLLSKHTANQIAAGEVVERPASVVKELVENSIDAGSTAVTIDITGGGIEYIRVSDNGSGILPEDVPTAFMSHATSKIATSEDLDNISTLGFRGEALASIAAVSRLSMKTRVKDMDFGTSIAIEGGEVKECVESGCPDGTAIEVRSLFYNVPARLKFLRSQRAEAGAISDYVARMIIGNPQITFRLTNNGKPVYQSPGDGNLRSAIFCVYGGETLPHLKKAEYDDGRFIITGYVGTEKLARPNRQQQSLYVNSRYVRSHQISFGIQRAFDTRLMAGKFPFYVLNMQVDCSDVDVNVHPNKLEVRFKEEQDAVRAATIAARMALGDPVAPVISHREIKPEMPALQSEERRPMQQPRIPEPAHKNAFYDSDMPRSVKKTPVSMNDSAGEESLFRSYMPPGEHPEAPKPSFAEQAAQEVIPEVTIKPRPDPADIVQEAEQVEFGYTHYDIIGQLFGCYWIIQQGENVFFVDQHALHERTLYESIMSRPLEPDSQMLLMPVIEKLTPIEYEILMSSMDAFRELGFDIEEFGPLTVSVRAVPAILNEPETVSFLHDALGRLNGRNRITAKEMKRAELIQSACKHAVKAGALLTNTEINILLRDYAKSGVPMTCPHGRPVMVRMTKLEFEKLFKRVL